MKILYWIGGAVVALFVLLLAAGFVLPREVSASRSIVIDATAEEVFPYVADFNRFYDWSPWTKRDPDMENIVEGEPATVGHVNRWSGNSQVGTGSQTIIEVRAPDMVRTRLEFEGQAGFAEALMTLAPVADGVEVTWSFSTDLGASPFARLFGPIIGPAVSKDYDEGLANLKAMVEAD